MAPDLACQPTEMDELSVLLGSLSVSNDRVSVLESIRPAIGKLSRAELASGLAAASLDLGPVFQCLDSGDGDTERVGCEVLGRLLQALDPALVLSRYSDLIERGLSHQSNRVAILCISQLARSAQDEELVAQLIKLNLVSPCLECLGGDLAVATQATSLAVSLSETKLGLKALVNPPTPKQLQELMGRDSVIQLRVLELVVKVGVLGEEHLQAMVSCGLVAPLVALLHTEDCLATLSAVELLISLALPPHGQRFLETSGVMARMSQLLEDANNHPLGSVLVPGLVKFFGNLAHSRPRQVVRQYPAFVSNLAAMAESDDLVAQSVAMETIGYIGVSLEGKLALAELGNRMTNCIDKLETLLTDSPTEVRIRAINAFASLIKLDKENQTSEFLSLTESWFRRVPSTLAQLGSIVKQPFHELRMAAYHLLQVLCGQPWGRVSLVGCAGLVETLLDRSSERVLEGKQEKYRLLQALQEGGGVRELLGEEVDMQLRLYVRQGPLYVQVQSQVATEGE